jgi:hypothetical protein
MPRHQVLVAPSHAWLVDLLFRNRPGVTWAAKGKLPSGFEYADRFVVLPGPAGRKFLLSLATRRGSSSALTSYNRLRPGRTRLARRVLALGLSTGLAQPLLRNKIDVGIVPGTSPGQLAADLLGEHLRQLFGYDRIVMAMGVGTGPYRKPVLQVFAAGGAPLGYVKIGWNDWARQAVRREAAALQACAERRMRLGVPEFLGLSHWQGLELLITGPLPRGVRRLDSKSGLPDVGVLREISELAPGFSAELAASPWWLSVRTRIQTVTDPEARLALALAAEHIERAHGRVTLSFGAWHGDLVPWNLAWHGSRLYAWDWESSTPCAPLGFDAVHFHYSVAFIADGRPLADAAAIAAENAGAALHALGVPEPAHRLVALLHMVELAVSHEEARGSTGDVDQRFYPAVLGVLEREVPGARGLVGRQSEERVP